MENKALIKKALNDLINNQDLELKTPIDKVVNYLSKELKQNDKVVYNSEELSEKNTETIKKMDLANKISLIQADIKDLIKDEKVKSSSVNYKYFEESQILKILKPLLKHYRVRVLITDDDTQPFKHEKDDRNHFLEYLKQVKLTNLDNKEDVEIVKFWTCGSNNDLAKAKGSAETYATKYILSKLFLIRVIDENEPDLKKPDENKTINPAENEKKRIMEKVILKNDGWYYCKRCEEAEGREFKLIEKHPNLKLNELKEALLKHGEL